MLDIWYTFPAAMGEDQAWTTYSHGYAEIADADGRNNQLRVKAVFNNPTEYGMPTNEEFQKLSELDDALDNSITKVGGVYVGRITVSGHRFFYFYVDKKEDEIKQLIDHVSSSTKYDLKYTWKIDPKKEGYWSELYPTSDDWQVIQDLKVLDALAQDGDVKDKRRTVEHWAYFEVEKNASVYRDWVGEQNYKLLSFEQTEDNNEYLVKFSHMGTMDLRDITSHTISLNRKTRELGGIYDGWETSVER